jgi:hypothetical protein
MVGTLVTVPAAKKGIPARTGTIESLLAQHAWVKLDNNQGFESGGRKKVSYLKITVVPPAPAVVAPAPVLAATAAAIEPATDGAGVGGDVAAASTDASLVEGATSAAWESATAVFGADGDLDMDS